MTSVRARAAQLQLWLVRFVTLRVAFVLMSLATLLSGVAALTALQAQRDAKATADRLAEETDARETQACIRAIETRAEQEQMLVAIATELGARQRIFDIIHASYDALPTPAPCSPTPGGR